MFQYVELLDKECRAIKWKGYFPRCRSEQDGPRT